MQIVDGIDQVAGIIYWNVSVGQKALSTSPNAQKTDFVANDDEQYAVSIARTSLEEGLSNLALPEGCLMSKGVSNRIVSQLPNGFVKSEIPSF